MRDPIGRAGVGMDFPAPSPAVASFGAMLARYAQDTRLVRLHTKLGADVLLPESAHIVECVFGMESEFAAGARDDLCGYRIEVDVVARDAHLELKCLVGQPVLVELLTQASRIDLRPFHGHVTSFALLGGDGGVARYRLIVEPWLAFLRWRTDSFVFQDRSVIGVLEDVFADYVAQGALTAEWRVPVADRTRYRPISLVTQYRESDLAFVRRLAAQEGLMFWFEHSGQPDSPSLGRHTLVIADDNAAFAPGAQTNVRFARAQATTTEDAIQIWQERAVSAPRSMMLRTWDYRTLEQRTARAGRGSDTDGLVDDHPGAYAACEREDAERYVRLQDEALRARDRLVHAEGTVRTLAPGTTIALREHAQVDAVERWGVLAVEHRANNNLGLRAHAPGDMPLYRQHAILFPTRTAYRPLLDDERGLRLHPKPTVHGTQTAIVAGIAGLPVTTDRDHRIKLQFAWARGRASASRLAHPGGDDNAPGNETSGTWVRVAEPLAGANWGTHFVPRSGQEVLVDFLEGDIDRPVIVGAVYNGQGHEDAQGNRQAQAAGGATANAPAWFPGAQGKHAHDAVLSGFKSQALVASQSGADGHNTLVFDATPGKARVSLFSTQAASGLHLGHLRRQIDNQLADDRGHGAELATAAQGAVRAGAGLLLAAEPHAAGQIALHDAATALVQFEDARAVVAALAEAAHRHGADLGGEPASAELAALRSHQQASADLCATHARGDAEDPSARVAHDESAAIRRCAGGAGTVPAWTRAHLVASARAGVGLFSPASQAWAAGAALHFGVAQDIGFTAGGELRAAGKDGLALFTQGSTPDAQRPEQACGIRLHAATGRVSVQAQSAGANLAAQRDVAVQSTNAAVLASAPEHQLLATQGAYIRIAGGNIEVHAPGQVSFKAGQKNWAGPADAGDVQIHLSDAKDLFDEQFVVVDESTGQALAGEPYHIVDATGAVVAQGMTGVQGETARYTAARADHLTLKRGLPD